MIKPPPGHLWVPTQDGSHTLINELYQETCHSTAGAQQETFYHYIQGTRLREKYQLLGSVKVLEIGFGLGIGLKCTLEALKTIHPTISLEFVSLEKDSELVNWYVKNHTENFIKINESSYQLIDRELKITIVTGEARKSIKFLNQKFDCIYQDAFSPKKNPELWTWQWFSDLKKVSHLNTVMSTYSSSVSIRKSMIKAGWQLYEGGAFAHKRASTRACLNSETLPSIIENLARSPIEALDDTIL